nr:MAG TPA: hypothetical protein [Caudoviricetes sp.]
MQNIKYFPTFYMLFEVIIHATIRNRKFYPLN